MCKRYYVCNLSIYLYPATCSPKRRRPAFLFHSRSRPAVIGGCPPFRRRFFFKMVVFYEGRDFSSRYKQGIPIDVIRHRLGTHAFVRACVHAYICLGAGGLRPSLFAFVFCVLCSVFCVSGFAFSLCGVFADLCSATFFFFFFFISLLHRGWITGSMSVSSRRRCGTRKQAFLAHPCSLPTHLSRVISCGSIRVPCGLYAASNGP